MNENDHRLVMAEPDALKQQVASTMQKFEATGFAVILKDDYVAFLGAATVGCRSQEYVLYEGHPNTCDPCWLKACSSPQGATFYYDKTYYVSFCCDGF